MIYRSIILACLLVITASAQVPNLRGHWPFEASALDASGHGRNGTVTNVTYGIGRIGGGAVCGGGAGGGIFVPGADFDLPGNFSFSIHASASVLSPITGRVLAQRYLTGVDQLWYFAMFSNKLRLTVYNNASTRLDYDVPYIFLTNTWYHAAFVFNANNTISIYVDGSRIGEPTAYIGAVRTSAAIDFTIGYSTAAEWTFIGTLDDARFYSYSLSEREVRQIMLGQAPGEGPK